VLIAVRSVNPYGKDHFGGKGYSAQAAEDRANLDRDQIMNYSYFQNFQVPPEPIASLIQNAGSGWPLNIETVEAANNALWRITTFNQLVQQQTNFNAAHVSEFLDKTLDIERRQALAKAGRAISVMIHGSAIGDTQWYPRLITALDRNIQELEQRKTRWWSIGRVRN